MALACPDDRSVDYLDRQYMLGNDILVAPVFSAEGDVEFYLPAGQWTSLLTGETVAGGGWRRESHGFDSLPLYVREGAVLPRSQRTDRPDYDYLEALVLDVFAGPTSGQSVTTVTAEDSRAATFTT